MNYGTFTFFLFIYSLHCQAQFGTQQIISTEHSIIRSVDTADIDGDGDMDVLSASEGDDKVAWYENTDGLGDFGAQQIITQNLHGPVDVFATDLDGDEDMDVLVASKGDSPEDSKIVWYENLDGMGDFSTIKIITNLAQGAVSVFAVDLDGDEDMDVLSASFKDNTIAWYENIDGLGNFGNQQIISNSALSTRDVYAADLDGDGDKDVLVASTASDEILWFENTDGFGNFGTANIITSSADGVLSVYAIDLDNDNDIDVLSSSPGNDVIAWYENTDGLGTFGPPQIITYKIDGARGVFATDIDNDGDNDVLSISSFDEKLAWYENLTLIGINEFSIKIALYPNPVKTILIIENNIFHLNKVQMYDLLGRLVLEQINPNNQIDVSSLDSGLLFVKIETNKGTFMKKVLKE